MYFKSVFISLLLTVDVREWRKSVSISLINVDDTTDDRDAL